MIELHAAVDDGDAHVASGRRGVQLVELPLARGRLQAKSGSSWPSAWNTFMGCAQATRGSRARRIATSSARCDAGTSMT